MLVIVSKQYSDNKWLLAAVVFIMIPSSATNKYHTVPAFAALLMLWAIEKWYRKGKRFLSFWQQCFRFLCCSPSVIKPLLLMVVWSAGRTVCIYLGTSKERTACISLCCRRSTCACFGMPEYRVRSAGAVVIWRMGRIWRLGLYVLDGHAYLV